ncbi:MAG: portal protein, partial [Candidatus Marinimicrobia bacterium]|nr:portal protein [Candidatus Neomarinimicrobiota bacterium]
MIQLFGYQIGRVEKEDKKRENIQSFTAPANHDAAMTVAENGVFGTYLDMDATSKNEAQLITKYRELALSPEGERAIDDIVNEAIIMENYKSPVEIKLDKLEQPEAIKKKITEEFEQILKLMDFNNKAYDIFKRWYVDGRLYYHKMIDVKKPRQGILELRYIDPRKIKKVRKQIAPKDTNRPVVSIAPSYKEFYLYNERGIASNMNEGIRIAKDSITYVHSGIINERNTIILSHLNKALKIWNQMRWMEDSLVIYRISRAPERRIFYIDVGNLPKMKAEQYLKD